MKVNNLLWLFCCIVGFINCDGNKDDGWRSFMQEATIIGDSINGFYCYMDGGGLAVSYDRRLAGIERGYFSINYMEDDWTTTADHAAYIDNAHIFPFSIYDVLRPVSREETAVDTINCAIPPFLSVNEGYRGYFDLNTGLSVVNVIDGKTVPVEMKMLYDRTRLTPDTLILQFCYNLHIPAQWTNVSFNYGTISCDISSFASLQTWSDSVTIVVEAGEGERHLRKISKNDFLKPDIKIE